jgi:hypothetical protein
VTESIHASPTDDPPAESGLLTWWYVNTDRTIWATAGKMMAGSNGNKVGWIRPRGTQLVVMGRRLDAQAAAAEIDIPCCYGGRFQASGIMFPSEGCWEISARAGESELRFVTRVSRERASG